MTTFERLVLRALAVIMRHIIMTPNVDWFVKSGAQDLRAEIERELQ